MNAKTHTHTARHIKIKPSNLQTVQEQINDAVRKGFGKIILEGTFRYQGKNAFSLLTLTHDIEIYGNGKTLLDGRNRVTHIMFVDDYIKVKVEGVQFINGNTTNLSSQLSLENHPKKKLNLFRYLDGGAISIGEGSEVILENCVFDSNRSAICAGALSNLGGYVNMNNCVFRNNESGDTGAAVDNLARGSLTIIENSRFENNQANKLGKGTFGTITAFPHTCLMVKNSDFSKETNVAIDYKSNRKNASYIDIDNKTLFNRRTKMPVVKNPISNISARNEIIKRSLRIILTHPHLVKVEGIPKASKKITLKHREIFYRLINDNTNRIST